MRAIGAIAARPPAVGGMLRAYVLDVDASSQCEITLTQRTRRGTVTKRPPPTDMLLLLLRAKAGAGGGGGGNGGGSGGGGGECLGGGGGNLAPAAAAAAAAAAVAAFEGASLLACSARSTRDAVSCEALVSRGRYFLVPLSLHPPAAAKAGEEHRVVLRLGSSKPVHLDTLVLPTAAAAAALAAYARRGARRDAFDGMSMWTLQDGAGLLSYAENRAAGLGFSVDLDHAGSSNVSPSRGAARTADTLLPMHGQLVQVLDAASDERSCQLRAALRFGAGPASAEAHAPSVGSSYVHCPRALSSAEVDT